jgi:hypothetical protein
MVLTPTHSASTLSLFFSLGVIIDPQRPCRSDAPFMVRDPAGDPNRLSVEPGGLVYGSTVLGSKCRVVDALIKTLSQTSIMYTVPSFYIVHTVYHLVPFGHLRGGQMERGKISRGKCERKRKKVN